jgi:lipopolysaccharide transport system ATP-binding protein
MNDVAIRVDNLSKRYRIGQREPYKTLRGALTNLFKSPFQCRDGEPQFIWALKDVSFEVKWGEVVGVIGRNGAGKTTLLKILSRITEPTEGYGEVCGRVGSLLEVGTGFHLELTGRENIYLSGAILGMKKAEIDRKFDEIVQFAGVEKFIDTPVKRYSSGMLIRLAFSVAAHLEPEILLIDEVLAVGDVEFQKKCLGKMRSVTGEGRTVLFVSHNMAAIRNLCPRTLVIENGGILLDTETETAIARYLDRNLSQGAVVSAEQLQQLMEGVINRANPTIRFKEIALMDQEGLRRNTFQSDEEIRVSITYECLMEINNLLVVVCVVDEGGVPILVTQNADTSDYQQFYRREPGVYTSLCSLPGNTFGQRRFYLSVHLINIKTEHLVLNKILSFDVEFKGYNMQYSSFEGIFRPLLRWETHPLT